MNKLLKIMEEKGVTAYRISHDIGIPESTFSHIKTGRRKAKNLTVENAIKISRYLNVPVEELFDEEDLK